MGYADSDLYFICIQSLNIPMSGKAVDKLMRKLDVDDDGEIDFA